MTGFVENEWTRRPSGAGGGQFLERTRTEPEVTLALPGPDEVAPALAARLRARRDALRQFGYVPGAAQQTGNPYQDIPASRWWGMTSALAEVKPEGYPVMPPVRGSGARSYLRRYAGDETALKMPSATSVRAFADEVGGTFDIPVEASTPHGPVTGHVRVTRNGPGRWSVSAPSMNGPQAQYVCESVSAVLEARRPTKALPAVVDILERRRMRLATAGMKPESIRHSSWIDAAGYNDADEQMVIRLNGRAYGYHVDADTYHAVVGAASPGSAYNRLVKRTAPGFEVAFHDDCGRYYKVSDGHRCPSRHTEARDVRRENAWLMRSLTKV